MTDRQRAYHHEYYQRPGPKAQKKAYAKAYRQRPEVKEKQRETMRERYRRPEIAESLREYRHNPEIQERERNRRQRPSAQEKAKAYHLNRNYGLSLEAFNAMFLGQGSRCAICQSTDWGHKGPVVDHDHNTGAVRGIVCHQCNVAIGFIKDDPRRARAIADYLEMAAGERRR